jgi:hypothetical protein
MAAELTRVTHKIAIQLHLVAESCTICSSRSRRPVRKLLDTSYMCRQGLGIFSSPSPDQLWDPPKPPIQFVPGALSLEVKWPGCEADHSPPSSADVKNAWSYTSSPQYAFMAWCSDEAQGQLYLYAHKHISNTRYSIKVKSKGKVVPVL